jgi:glycosyltransferase involved in cell wall biosynthesis
MKVATEQIGDIEAPTQKSFGKTGSPESDAVATALPTVFLMTNSFETGGSERQFISLARSLDPSAFRLQIGCIMRKGVSAGPLSEVPEFGVGGSLYGWRSWKARFELARYLRRRRVAVAHAFDFYTNLVLIPAARLAGVPVVIGSQRQLGDLLTPNKARAQREIFRFADTVVCNSQAAASALLRSGVPEHKVTVIANGIPDHFFAATIPALPREPGVFRVGMIARMNTPAKNHSVLLEAAAQIFRTNPTIEFVFVGDGPLRPELENAASGLGIANCVRFLGERQDVQSVLASLDIAVLPSDSESLSNAVLEAMAVGVPVIATNVGGNPELIGTNRGVLVPPRSVSDLANAIERLASNVSIRQYLATNAREFVAANFTMEQMRKRHEQLYRDLLERHNWRANVQLVPGLRPKQRSAQRVALVCVSLRYVGGHSAQADMLLRGWKDDPSVSATLIPIDPRLPKALSWAERIPGLRTLTREPLYLWSLWRGLKNADIAHIFSASYWSFLIAPSPALAIARLRGKKALIHYHSGEARDHLQRSRLARFILKKASRLVVPSEFLVNVFQEFGLRTQVVPNVVDLEQFSFHLRNPLRPHLVCTRGFHAYYSVDVVVQAFALVKKEFPSAKLDLVGGGPEEREIRELVRKLQLADVGFVGTVTRQEVPRFYHEADIFINASCLDNMPVSVLEAFASGTPVVSTAPEGIRYLVEHERTGLLSPPGDAEALAANVIRVLKDRQLATQLALNARAECERYSWSTVRGQWLEVYRSLAAS